MAYMHGRHETDRENRRRFNTELVVAMGFNFGAWVVVGTIAMLIVS